MQRAAISLSNLTLGYDRHPAVHHLSAEIDAGSLTAIVGPNGAGKSTLMKALSGQLKPLEGKISIAPRMRDRIAYLPQQSALDKNFPVCVYDFIAMGLWRQVGPFGAIGRPQRRTVEDAIAAVGLTGFEQRTIGTLSGGQMQRAMFARLLLQDAELILLDEPFTSVDARTVNDLVNLVRRWHEQSRTILVILHDLDAVRSTFPKTLLLAREPVAFGRTADVLRPENLLRARRMCEAFDDTASVCLRPEEKASQ